MKPFYQIAADGVPIDIHDNFHPTMREAVAYFKTITIFKGWKYSIVKQSQKTVKKLN